MKLSDLKILIEEGESFSLEFKRKVSSPLKIAKTLSSFANTKGGIVLFGVDDDKSIIGVDSEKSEIELINQAAKYYCIPPLDIDIDTVAYKNRDVIVVAIEESLNKPHFVNSDENNSAIATNVFIRVNDKTIEASKEVVKILKSESIDAPPLRLVIGQNEQRLFEYLDANERITVKEYSELINISKRRASRSLIQLVRAGIIRIHTHEKSDYFTKS